MKRHITNILILVVFFVFGFAAGYDFERRICEVQTTDTLTYSEGVAWCVKGNIDAMIAQGAPAQAIQAELPGMTDWCTANLSLFLSWLEEQRERREP
jgi:hypothetical protein